MGKTIYVSKGEITFARNKDKKIKMRKHSLKKYTNLFVQVVKLRVVSKFVN